MVLRQPRLIGSNMAKSLYGIALAAFLATALCTPLGAREAPAYSNVASDETIVFFRTAGWLDEKTGEWHLPIHGWVYQPQESRIRRALFERLLTSRYDLTVDAETEPNFSRRLNLLIADNERGKRIVISIAGRTEVLPASGPNGHFTATLTLPADELSASGDGASVPFRAVMSDTDGRDFGGRIRLIGPRGVSVISDIDDTVKVSNVNDRRQLLEKALLRDFAQVPDMAEFYQAMATCGARFHFVSASPWQLYPPLIEFLDAAGFPWATLDLKIVRFRDETLFDLFKQGTETKPPAIRAILDRYPDRQFVLVGDSGEQDPEVYAGLIRERPAQIQRIYIRNVTGEASDDERYLRAFDGIDAERWQLFETPKTLDYPGNCP